MRQYYTTMRLYRNINGVLYRQKNDEEQGVSMDGIYND